MTRVWEKSLNVKHTWNWKAVHITVNDFQRKFPVKTWLIMALVIWIPYHCEYLFTFRVKGLWIISDQMSHPSYELTEENKKEKVCLVLWFNDKRKAYSDTKIWWHHLGDYRSPYILMVLSFNCFFFLIFKTLAAQFSKVKLIFTFEHVINKRPYFMMTMYSKHPLYLED